MKITILIFLCALPFTFANLSVGFYSFSCPMAEIIVFNVVQRHFIEDGSISAALLRMHFHDCFVRGCDASVLIDPTNTTSSEKQAVPNKSLRGFEIIDEAKRVLEQSCPSTVSCADIIALATRDAVGLAGGPIYIVPTGRRDGLVSNVSQVKLPAPSFNVSQALQHFTAKGFTLFEMVTLLGGHSIGFAHCSTFRDRLSSSTVHSDPTMDPVLDATLVKICGSSNSSTMNDPTVFLDQNTPLAFDNQFYIQLIQRRGILNIDQQLALDPSSKDFVSSFAQDGASFQVNFANAMIKLGSVDVLVGNDGEIRNNCRAFNFPR
ncbi:peroxidase 44-like [Gastrolobium bilobum]|uniref:peroxidase 44-like n=1 Tax=Gastrolobium bilobum TaxID=150636 RepID=UPI002AB2716E|nr:peroxidase 44-like [Gastrolobium bilobum]